MSTIKSIKSLRIKKEESEQIKAWIEKNKENIGEERSESEIIHRFIFYALCNLKIGKNGRLVSRK
jgi:hypothetical protein